MVLITLAIIFPCAAGAETKSRVESVDHTGERFKAEFYSKEKIQTNIQQTGSGTYMGCN